MLGKPGDGMKAVLPCQADLEFGGFGGGFEPYRPGAEPRPPGYSGSGYQDIGLVVRGKTSFLATRVGHRI